MSIKKCLLIITVIMIVIMIGLTGCSKEGDSSIISKPRMAAQEFVSGVTMMLSQQNIGLWVIGDGKVTAVPDTAILSLGIEVQEDSISEAQRKAADAIEKVIKALKAKGVADKDIQTQRFSIAPVRRWLDKENKEEIIGYRVTNFIITKIRQVDKAGSIIDDVAIAGGDLARIDDINFTVDDPISYYKDARAMAIAHAVAKAKQMADAAGVKIGRLLYMTENTSYIPPGQNYFKAETARVPTQSQTSISLGELEYQVDVQMVYEMK